MFLIYLNSVILSLCILVHNLQFSKIIRSSSYISESSSEKGFIFLYFFVYLFLTLNFSNLPGFLLCVVLRKCPILLSVFCYNQPLILKILISWGSTLFHFCGHFLIAKFIFFISLVLFLESLRFRIFLVHSMILLPLIATF